MDSPPSVPLIARTATDLTDHVRVIAFPILAVFDVEEHELRSDALLKIAIADHSDGG
jgi:hypothetical protein